MTKSKFDQIVENRANERVQNKIAKCRKAIFTALNDVLTVNFGSSESRTWPYDHQKILSILASPDTSQGWPQKIWEHETQLVTKELLATMDEMQAALIASKPSLYDFQPEPPKEQS